MAKYRRLFGSILDEVERSRDTSIKVELPNTEAYRMYLQIKQFRKDNPEATWRETFEKIPSKYINCRSMKDATNLMEKKIRKLRMKVRS